MRIAAIDPGMRAIGYAEATAETGWLVFAGASTVRETATPAEIARAHVRALLLRRNAAHDPSGRIAPPDPARVYVESMRYRPRAANSFPNDLLDVQTCGLLVAHRLAPQGEIVPIEVEDWKRNLPKAIHHARLDFALTTLERELVSAACDRAGAHAKEVLDAVGILLFALGRIDKAGRVRDFWGPAKELAWGRKVT